MVDIATKKGIASVQRISAVQAIVQPRVPSTTFSRMQPFLDTNLQTDTMKTGTTKSLFSASRAQILSVDDLSARTRIQITMGKKIVIPIITQKQIPAYGISKPNGLSYKTTNTSIPNPLDSIKSMALAGLMLLALGHMARSVLPRQKRL
ncbi:MAG: hypothetical protein ABIG39_07100 [Candidatus Micrarchaeota archaeon]